MVRITMRGWLAVLLMLVQSGHSTPAAEGILATLQRRQNSCPSTAPLSCQTTDSKLPSNFCCPTGTTCISLDSSSTALCCPSGSSCGVIQPIDCDISFEDPTKFRAGPVFTTRLSEKLATCGDKCCPFGYTCAKDGSNTCQIVANRAVTQSPSSSVTSAARSSIASSTPTSDAATTTPAVSSTSQSGIDSDRSQSSQPNNSFPPTVFLAGFFPGMLVGALLVLAWVIFTGRHKKPEDSPSPTSSVYKKKPYISGPVPVDSQSARTDFLRKSSGMSKSAKSLFSKKSQNEGTPGLPFDNWKMPTPPEPNNVPEQPVGRQIAAGQVSEKARHNTTERSRYSSAPKYPVTPERQVYGQQPDMGMETIHIYSPGPLETPSAVVAPLRGMNSRDRSRSSGSGGPFTTPDRSFGARMAVQPTPNTDYSYEGSNYETLTPARYNGGAVQRRPRPEDDGRQSRPETTFTAMLEAINFPDPMNRQQPRVPSVPGQYRR